MTTYTVEYSATINARPDQVYGLFRDYRVSHPAVLPKPYFEYLTVEQGGLGEGTRFSAGMNLLGTKSILVATVSEPEPGRMIVEQDDEGRIKTYFIMDPLESGQKTRVTLRTEIRSGAGLQGIIERLVMPPTLRKIYKLELANVEHYLAAKK